METTHNSYSISDDRSRLDMKTVHGWLAQSYWSPGVSFERVLKAADGAQLVVGAYSDTGQVGYLRIVSDKITFGWISDVFVVETERHKGIARAMVRFALEHEEYLEVRRWMLATRDAHEVYRSLGFGKMEYPDHFMWKGTQIPK